MVPIDSYKEESLLHTIDKDDDSTQKSTGSSDESSSLVSTTVDFQDYNVQTETTKTVSKLVTEKNRYQDLNDSVETPEYSEKWNFNNEGISYISRKPKG